MVRFFSLFLLVALPNIALGTNVEESNVEKPKLTVREDLVDESTVGDNEERILPYYHSSPSRCYCGSGSNRVRRVAIKEEKGTRRLKKSSKRHSKSHSYDTGGGSCQDFTEVCQCADDPCRITVDFQGCDPEPADFVGLYPCNAQQWEPSVWSYTCKNGACGHRDTPRESVTFDGFQPAYTHYGSWTWPLIPGCYVAKLTRIYGDSAPPYDLVAESGEFIITEMCNP